MKHNLINVLSDYRFLCTEREEVRRQRDKEAIETQRALACHSKHTPKKGLSELSI